MLMLREGQFVADPWQQALHLTEEALRGQKGSLDGAVLVLKADTDYRDLAPYAGALNALISIDIIFSSFADGRGFSLARNLREQLGYQGELRASGALIPDQATYLLESGFSSFLLEESLVERHGYDSWQRLSPLVRLRYQHHVRDKGEGRRRTIVSE